MFLIAFWTLLFCISTVISITLTGSRSIISGEINIPKIFQILFSWQFIVGAFFAFLSRLFFILVNNSVFKIPDLSQSSTTITTMINLIAIIFVIIANHFFLDESISQIQVIGAILVLSGVWIMLR
jgi:drug/metabolite transporter (DMT)-like permease